MSASATRIEVRDTGVVFRNPRPSVRSVQAIHPSLVVFDDGEMLCGFDLGQGPESLDYKTHLARSRDGGVTWTLERPILEQPPPGRPTTHSIRLGRVGDEILAFGALFYRDDPDEGLVNKETFGYVPVDVVLTRSRDRGRSWSPLETIAPPLPATSWECMHAIVALPDGRWLAPISVWRTWDGSNPHGEQALVFISDDRGRDWPRFGRTFDGRQSGLCHFEQSVVRLTDGRILAVAWQHDVATGQNLPSPYAISTDRGETFSAPRPTGFLAQTCKMTVLRDGRILAVYRRNDQPGLWATLARVDGDRWVNLAEAPIWQGAPSGMSGRLRSAEELVALRFGYPTPVQLADGDVYLVFWCVEDCVSYIRWFRLRVADGVTRG